MKLLGWMHRKLMHNSTDPVKNYTIGNSSVRFSSTHALSADEHSYYFEFTKSSTRPSVKRERSLGHTDTYDEPFDFLTIGTFGTELIHNTDPPTPTFPTPAEALTGQPIEITENDLDFISHELEKFLESEDAETGYNSSERSSWASVITITDQAHPPILASCPLQNYLLAAPVGLAETSREEVKKTRISLEELFKEGKVSVDGGPQMKKGQGGGERERGKGNVTQLVKKAARRLSPISSNGNTAGFYEEEDDTAVFWPIKKTLAKKLVKMFHKKVYPEEATGKRLFNVTKCNKKKKYGYSKEDHLVGSKNSDQPASNKCRKNTMSLLCPGVCRGTSPVDAGHWIKTDSDYLVLEL